MQKEVECSNCGGSGLGPYPSLCYNCGGAGKITSYTNDVNDWLLRMSHDIEDFKKNENEIKYLKSENEFVRSILEKMTYVCENYNSILSGIILSRIKDEAIKSKTLDLMKKEKYAVCQSPTDPEHIYLVFGQNKYTVEEVLAKEIIE